MIANSGFKQPVDRKEASQATDKDLEAKVYHALRGNAMIQSEKIGIRVSGRRVYLEGTVRSEEERILAQECIENIFGIRNIINYITFSRYYED